MCVGGTRDTGRQDLRERHIPSRNGQFPQCAAEARGEPGNGMQTPHRSLGRRHTVQQDEGSAVSGRGKRDRGVVLVGASGVSGLGGEFDAHSASLPEARAGVAGSGRRAPRRPVPAGHAPELDRNDQLRRGVAAHPAKARRARPTGAPHMPAVPHPGTCPPTPRRCSLLRVARQAMRDRHPPALEGSGAVTGGALVLTDRHPGPRADEKQECEHRCRRCGLGAKASRRPPKGPRRARPHRRSVRRSARPRTP